MQGISDLITIPGVINLDFADVKSVMKGMGVALMGIGRGRGQGAAVQAMKTRLTRNYSKRIQLRELRER